jgi:hypothetical protein
MLDVGQLIQVTVNVGATPVLGRTFNVHMIAGDSNVISGQDRFRTYESLDEVATDFGLLAPEYNAAAIYFGQKNPPSSLMIGRWVASATSGFNLGGILTPAQQLLSNFTSITNGGFQIALNGGAAVSVTGLNFSSVTNLNGVASIISAAMATASIPATCTWNGQSFQITANSTGAGAYADGSITLTANPAQNDTLTVGGTEIIFVGSSPVGNQCVIGANTAATLSNLLTLLQQSQDSNLDQCTYAQGTGNVVEVTFKTPGTGGNAFTLAKSSTAITLSGSTLAGGSAPSTVSAATPPGSGTDVSALLELTSATLQELVSGYNAEQPADAALALMEASTVWYGLMFATTNVVSVAQNLAVAELVQGSVPTRIFGVTNGNGNTLSAAVANDISSLLQAGNYGRSFSQYSATSPANIQPYAIADILGIMSVNFNQEDSTINVMWQQPQVVEAENISPSQANTLKSKNCNVYAEYDNNSAILQWGVMADGTPIDQRWGSDWFQNACQTAVYNLLYTAGTKVPQTTAGQNQEVSALAAVCGDTPGGAVYNGFAAPGVWNSETVFGSLTFGQYLPQGYYIYAEPIDSQPEADRIAREAPPVYIALKLAGAFDDANVIVTVNQ